MGRRVEKGGGGWGGPGGRRDEGGSLEEIILYVHESMLHGAGRVPATRTFAFGARRRRLNRRARPLRRRVAFEEGVALVAVAVAVAVAVVSIRTALRLL